MNLSNCCGLGTSTTQQLSTLTQTSNINHKMPNTVYEKDETGETDKKGEMEEKDEEDEDDEEKKEKKLHTTPNSSAVRRGCNRWRADRQQQTPATLAIIYMLYYTEIQL